MDGLLGVDEKLLAESLDMQHRRDLFLIFKEAVNNTAKYSGATLVTIAFHSVNNHIVLQIQDNGKGFDRNGTATSNGLKNIEDRAKVLGGTTDIISAKNAGTTITVKIPAT